MNAAVDFPAFEKDLRRLLAAGAYAEIYERIARESARFPEQRMYLAYWQLGMAARLGEAEKAYALMDSLLADHLWISEDLLHQSPSLETLRGQPEFEERLAHFHRLQQQEALGLLPLLLLRKEGACEGGAKPCPLLLGLHADRQLAADAMRYWAPIAQRGWLVGAPQSMQAVWSRAYVWDNREFAQMEIERHVEALASRFRVDLKRLVVAGHDVGGELAAWLPVTNGITARGFIAIDPDGPMFRAPDQWMQLLQANEPQKLRGALLVGTEHPFAAEIRRTQEIFTAFDVPTRLFEVPGMVSSASPDYENLVQQALDFILS